MAVPRLASARPSFLESDRALARATQPFARFLRIEAAGGILLVAATIAALVWANSPWQASYESFWSTNVQLEFGSYVFEEDLAHLVNDLLMALFFFVVGMEIKRELVVGELRDRRAVALPAMAALGGMIVPASIYLAINAGGDGADGWGIPMATDIAFALGVLALLGSRVPGSVKVLLLTLAIVDDIGAIVVIAVFYTDDLNAGLLLVGLALAVLVAVMHRVDVIYPPLLVIAGLVLWLAVYESGVHATIAGVIMGLLTPARPLQTELEAEEIVDVLEGRPDLCADDVRVTSTLIKGSVSACDRLIESLHPWTSYVIVPIFALANAGIILSADAISSPSAVLTGVGVALVVGKLAGVVGFSWLAVRLGLARLPAGTRWGHVIGIGAVAGIGFTVSLFITGLAFESDALQDDAKIGTLVASIVAAAVGALILIVVARDGESSAASESG
ncbi:MAG: Na+/H+ antiporter NhaA [Nocardioidaceae bacterium]|nr:Na+/H+ antiporter NhaA [Nocardioidaceae bacterium]